MVFFEFLRFFAFWIIAGIVWHLIQAAMVKRNSDSDAVKAMAFVTGG